MGDANIKPIHWYKFHKFLLSVGCVYKRKKGSHRIYVCPELIRPIVVPEHTKPLPAFVVKNSLRLLGISEKEYVEKLKDI